jgi:hypothetical protein
MLSIVVTFVADGQRVLLGGDMEFAPDRLPDSRLGGPLRSLRQRITKLAPYGFLKLAHHGSRNGVDEKMLDTLGPSFNIGIVTGSGSENHPNAQVMGLLGARKNRLHWARTDRNGASSIDLSKAGTDAFTITRGELDDERAGGGDVGSVGSVGRSVSGSTAVGLAALGGGAVRRIPGVTTTPTGDGRSIEITVSVPVGVGARIALEVEPSGGVRATDFKEPIASIASSDGRRLAGVLVVTASEPLVDNVGAT